MLLNIQNLSIQFSTTTAVVSELKLSIKRGDCLGLVGESGSGKSLTALAIMQLLPSTASVSKDSKIIYDGDDLLYYSERRMRRIRGQRIGMIFQDAMSAFNPVYTIGNQLAEIIYRIDKVSTNKMKLIAYSLLNEVGIDDAKRTFDAYPHQLSGGMRQRAMIAMALAGKPEMLIADEPTTALDVTIQAQILELLKILQVKHDMSLLFISHDLAVVSQLANQIAVMRFGKKVEEADVSEFFQNPKTEYSRQLLDAIPNKHTHSIEQKQTLPLLQVKHLKVYFPVKKSLLKRTVSNIKAVDDISFGLASGQTLALVGESGSGKTTTGKAILKLLKSSQGKIIFNGNDLSTITHKNLRQLRHDMQIIFQDPYSALNPRMMIFNCIAEGLFAQRKVRNKQEAVDKVNHALQQVELAPDIKWRYPHEFSGGQRQRICIARALVLEPKLLILDEPTSALDVSIQMQILKLLEKLQTELNLTYLFITHNLSVVSYIADSVVVMYQGKIVEHGHTDAILNDPQHEYTRKLIASIPKIKEPKENV